MLIAQLSDPHIRPEGVLYRNVVDSNALIAAAIAPISALDPRPDLTRLSGIWSTGAKRRNTPAWASCSPSWQRRCWSLRATMTTAPPFDRPSATTAPSRPAGRCTTSRAVRIVALDVTVPGLHHGEVDEDSMLWLNGAPSAEPHRPRAVMMPQPPVECGVPYLDLHQCRNGERLATVVSRHPCVERILCGHVHRFMQLRFAGTVLCTAPSTTAAIALRLRPDAEPASPVEPPACLLHHWRPEVGLVRHRSQIGIFPGPYPLA